MRYRGVLCNVFFALYNPNHHIFSWLASDTWHLRLYYSCLKKNERIYTEKITSLFSPKVGKLYRLIKWHHNWVCLENYIMAFLWISLLWWSLGSDSTQITYGKISLRPQSFTLMLNNSNFDALPMWNRLLLNVIP